MAKPAQLRTTMALVFAVVVVLSDSRRASGAPGSCSLPGAPFLVGTGCPEHTSVCAQALQEYKAIARTLQEDAEKQSTHAIGASSSALRSILSTFCDTSHHWPNPNQDTEPQQPREHDTADPKQAGPRRSFPSPARSINGVNGTLPPLPRRSPRRPNQRASLSPELTSSSTSSSSSLSSSVPYSSPARHRPRRQEEDENRQRGSCSVSRILNRRCAVAKEETFVITFADLPCNITDKVVLRDLSRAVNELDVATEVKTLLLSGIRHRSHRTTSTVPASVLHHILNSTTWHGIQHLELVNMEVQNSFRFPSLRYFTALQTIKTFSTTMAEIEYTLNDDQLGTVGQSIRTISFVGCGLRSIAPIVFKGLYNLEKVNLSINGLSVLEPNQFGNLSKLTAVDLSRNRLTTLFSNTFGTHNNLTYLNLNDNRITHIQDSALLSLQNLAKLILRNNRLTALNNVANLLPPSLTSLDLSGNSLQHLPSMHAFSHLHTLRLGENKLSAIEARALSSMASLAFLDLGGNRLTDDQVQLLLEHTPAAQLRLLNLTDNRMKHIPDNMEKCSGLHTLILRSIGGRESSLELSDRPLLGPGNNLTTLSLSGNDLTHISAQDLGNLAGLQHLNLANNLLTQLGKDVLEAVPNLRVLALDNNEFQELDLCGASKELLSPGHDDEEAAPSDDSVARCPDNAPGMLQKLRALSIGNNKLTSLPLAIHTLEALDLRDNPLEKAIDIHSMEHLEFLSLANHKIKEIKLQTNTTYRNLRELELSASPDLKGGAMLDVAADLVAPQLTALTLYNVKFTSRSLQRFKVAQGLQKLHIGHSHFNDDTLPIQELCRLLDSEVSELKIVHTSHRSVDLSVCNDTVHGYENIFVTNNEHLTLVRVPTDVGILNLNTNPNLETIEAPKVKTLDVSRTNLKHLGELCDTLGTTRLLMRDMKSSVLDLDNADARDMLNRCVLYTRLLDISGNRVLTEHKKLQDMLPVVEISQQAASADEDNRNVITLLVMDNMPVTCALHLDLTQQPNDVWSDATGESYIPGHGESRTAAASAPLDRDSLLEAGLVRSALTYRFECSCAEGREGPRCESPRVPPETIAGIVLGIMLFNVVVWLVYERHFKRIRVLKQDSQLKQRLLSEKDEEVLQLRSAWRIDEGELRFIKRISHGASGDVYQAWWDNLEVAVKVLKNVDRLHLGDFEKELDFLQRTRHQNLVRFFGAGERADSTPFVVLEFVPLGSLHHLLAKDLDMVVTDALLKAEQQLFTSSAFNSASASIRDGVRTGVDSAYSTRSGRGRTASTASQRRRGMSMLANHEVGIAETDDLVHVVTTLSTSSEVRMPQTAWELKLALLQDVASGMAFIHTLGHVHRDLKSANVLVSNTLRAKIADFGTIKLSQQSGSNSSSGFFSGWQPPSDAGQETAMAAPVHTQVDDVVDMNMTRGVGTLLYMAPEALESESYDSAVDVFSFGVLMWEVVMQRTPDILAQELRETVRGPESAKILQLLAEGKRLKFPPDSGVPRWYQSMYAECTAFAPDERPRFSRLQEQLDLRRQELAMMANHS